MRRGLIRILCAFVLFAQQAALTHLIAHAHGAPAAHGHELARHDHDRSPAPDAGRLCAFDAVFGQLLSGGPASNSVFFSDSARAQRALYRSRAHIAEDALTPRSRGPPLLL